MATVTKGVHEHLERMTKRELINRVKLLEAKWDSMRGVAEQRAESVSTLQKDLIDLKHKWERAKGDNRMFERTMEQQASELNMWRDLGLGATRSLQLFVRLFHERTSGKAMD